MYFFCEIVGWLKIVGKIKSMGKTDWLHSFFMVVIFSDMNKKAARSALKTC